VSDPAAELLANAEALLNTRHLPAAREAFALAASAGAAPDRINGGLWQLNMLSGDFEQAWQQSDALRSRNAPDPHRFWTGESIAGKRLIVRCLHGFGDAVQMLRYAPQLRALASELTFEVPPRLLPLAPHFAGVHNVITWGDQAPQPPPEYDLQLEVMELPYLLRTTLADLPIATRYLQPDQRADLGQRTKPRVGIVWSAGQWNPSRSIPLKLLEPVLANPNIEFWSLAGQGSANEAAHLPIRHEPPFTDGILPLARTIDALDVVITVDTLAAHLAGALNKPALVLLQHAADWRWMLARPDSPWYPSLELLRQPTPGNGAAVLALLQQRLARLVL
jgi:hypothetical protein